MKTFIKLYQLAKLLCVIALGIHFGWIAAMLGFIIYVEISE